MEMGQQIEELKQSEKEAKEKKPTNELPALDDLLQCFSAEGVFEHEHMALIRGFLTDDSLNVLDSLLEANKGSPQMVGFILTFVATLIFEERFSVYKGEWELVQKKAKRKTRGLRGEVSQ